MFVLYNFFEFFLSEANKHVLRFEISMNDPTNSVEEV